jgi:hypothetical protein
MKKRKNMSKAALRALFQSQSGAMPVALMGVVELPLGRFQFIRQKVGSTGPTVS